MDDGVDRGRPHESVEDRVRLVGSDELGSLEGHRGVVLAEAEDHVDRRLLLERLDHASTPEGVGAGDEDASSHQPHQMLRLERSISKTCSWMSSRTRSACSRTKERG